MSATEDLRGLLAKRPLQLLALTVFLSWVGKFAVESKFCVVDLDIWWHVKVGDWIVEHVAVPHSGIFSRTAASRPWVAYSWGYEILLSRAYKWFGLVGVGLFGVIETLAIAYAVFWMVHRLSGSFWKSWVLSFATCYSFLFALMPRPVFVSILLFTVLLTLLMDADRTGNAKPLYWLPPIFVLWANIHIQFVYGLAVLGLYVGIRAIRPLAPASLTAWLTEDSQLPLRQTAFVAALCVLGTCIGPYSFHLYEVIYGYTKAKFAYLIIKELQPLSFRSWMHFSQLFLTAAAFFALGWRRKVDPFRLALLCLTTVVAYRTMRDAWFIVIPAAACIAESMASRQEPDASETVGERLGLGVVLALLIFLFARNADFSQRGLDRAISQRLPVDAVNYLRRNPLPGPLYNNLDWGGFLIWYLPQYPVAIDGRNDLYGDDMDRIFFDTQNAVNYDQDPYLKQAGFALLKKQIPLAAALKDDPDWQVEYEDGIAILLARRYQNQPEQ